jgi:hypothetical protein
MSDLLDPEEASATYFVRTRFVGGRFDFHAIPFDVLPDLAAYRDLIVEVAKYLFLTENKSRQRVPKNFVRSFQLGLTEVIRGNSATALADKLPWSHGERQSMLGFPSYFEAARDMVDGTIHAANDDAPINFPTELAKRFTAFGRNLRPDEYIEISHPGSARVAVFNRAVRKKIILTAENLYEDFLERDFILNGAKVSTTNIHLLDERGIDFEVRAQNLAQVSEALVRSSAKHRVHIVGTGHFNGADELVRIIHLDELTYVDEEPRAGLDAQLAKLEGVSDGWHNGGGIAPSLGAITRVRDVLAAIGAKTEVAIPFIYPTFEGGVTAEWTHEEWEISLTVPLGAHVVELYMLNVGTEEEFELASDHNDTIAEDFAEKWRAITGEGSP